MSVVSMIEVQWHSPDWAFAAGFLRDGTPWLLDGALVGMGPTRGAAVENLVGIARELVITGENFMTSGQVPVADRRWLFEQIDGDAPDFSEEAVTALRQAEEAAKSP
jgi:hypothetical protein